jgi:hypothetical protein
MRVRALAVALIGVAAASSLVASRLVAYPGGTPRHVTNMSPQCAGCHASVNIEQLRDLSPEEAAGSLPDKLHYQRISSGDRAYAKLSPEDREKLLAAVKTMDANSRVEMSVSATSLKPLAPLTVTVKTRGGAGPVVGVMLLDNDVRYQASPIQTEGFLITAAPKITGPDGTTQTKFLDARLPGLEKNLNYVNIQGVKSDPDAGTYAECSVVYSLRAPAEPGTYTVTAAYLFGTEKSVAVGRTETPDGRVMPVGGMGNSGRIAFAKTVQVTVKK